LGKGCVVTNLSGLFKLLFKVKTPLSTMTLSIITFRITNLSMMTFNAFAYCNLSCVTIKSIMLRATIKFRCHFAECRGAPDKRMILRLS